MEIALMSPVLPALRRPKRLLGFTLIELMIVVAIVAVLTAIALPSFFGQVRKSRRADAITRISQVQQAQERWRANNTTYGTLANTGVAATNSDGYYTLTVPANSATGYEVLATATGSQLSDANCKFMKLTLAGGDSTFTSGPTGALGNSATLNNQCWNK